MGDKLQHALRALRDLAGALGARLLVCFGAIRGRPPVFHALGLGALMHRRRVIDVTRLVASVIDAGMREAFRVLKPEGGSLWVKCKDEVEREVQRWSHIEIYEMALELGFCARDLFVLTGTTAPERWPGRVQYHARKTHSYLWVFERPDRRYGKLLAAARRSATR